MRRRDFILGLILAALPFAKKPPPKNRRSYGQGTYGLGNYGGN